MKRTRMERKTPLRSKGFTKPTLDALLGEGKIIKAKDAGPVLKRAFGKIPKVRTERQKAMEAADKWFSQWIRLRDSDEYGRVQCITCTHAGYWKSLQNGHFVTRGYMATRFDEQNCNTQCRGCNYNGGKHLKHGLAIEHKHGPGTVAMLEQKGMMTCRRSLDDLRRIAAEYKAKVMVIMQECPSKFQWQSA